eukprot:5038824-Prymnesium_polylepis.3
MCTHASRGTALRLCGRGSQPSPSTRQRRESLTTGVCTQVEGCSLAIEEGGILETADVRMRGGHRLEEGGVQRVAPVQRIVDGHQRAVAAQICVDAAERCVEVVDRAPDVVARQAQVRHRFLNIAKVRIDATRHIAVMQRLGEPSILRSERAQLLVKLCGARAHPDGRLECARVRPPIERSSQAQGGKIGDAESDKQCARMWPQATCTRATCATLPDEGGTAEVH